MYLCPWEPVILYICNSVSPNWSCIRPLNMEKLEQLSSLYRKRSRSYLHNSKWCACLLCAHLWICMFLEVTVVYTVKGGAATNVCLWIGFLFHPVVKRKTAFVFKRPLMWWQLVTSCCWLEAPAASHWHRGPGTRVVNYSFEACCLDKSRQKCNYLY